MADISTITLPNGDTYNFKDTAARNSIPSAATATPLQDGTGAVGSSSKYAKEDHIHPRSPKVTVSSSAPSGAISGDIWFKLVT